MPSTSTVVSFSPATTWALVTTTLGAATQPLPSMPSPQAVPSTLTTLGLALSTAGALTIPGGGAATFAWGPRTEGSGSIRASACRIAPDGGNRLLSPRRMAERWMSCRSTFEFDDCRAIAPTIQAIPKATDAVRAAPSSPSTVRSPGSRRNLRARAPTPSNPLASTAPARRAPSSPNNGAYSE